MMKKVLLLIFIPLAFAQQCTPQNGPTVCKALGPTAQCLLTSGGSSPQGYCWIPGTPTSSILPGQTNANNGVTCGNNTISFQCQLGQICLGQVCSNVEEAAKEFFTPLVIGIFVAGAVLLIFGSCLLCICCKCCCFAGRKITKGTGKAAAAPFRGRRGDKETPVVIRQTTDTAQVNAANPNQTLHGPYSNRKSKNMGPAPLAVDFNPSRTTQMFHVEEHIEIIPVVPSQPPPRPYSASAYPKNAQNSSASPYASPSSPYNAPYVTHTNFYPNQELHNSIEDPMYPDNYGVYGVPLELQIHQDACFDDSNVRETYALTPALLDSHKSAANEKIGPVVSLSKIPPSTEGFFGMWDRKGGFHQGFVDQDLYVHGGIFDDQCYFHFGAIGEDAVFVEDSMMACPDDIKAAARSDMPLDTLRDSRSYVGKANNEIGGVPSASASFLDLHHQEENIREGGESMDVFACSVQSPRYI